MTAFPVSRFEPHTLDSPCLVAVDVVPASGQGLGVIPPGGSIDDTALITEPGWFFCKDKGYHVHDHGGKFHAHAPRVGPCPLEPR